MNENLLRRIKRQLNAKFYVMNDAWLRDCVEFFITGKAPHEVRRELSSSWSVVVSHVSSLIEINRRTAVHIVIILCLQENETCFIMLSSSSYSNSNSNEIYLPYKY